MPIMYVDDSGSPNNTDQTSYFVLSGVIVHDDKIKDLQKAVCDYKHANFVNEYVDAEIHSHNIHKSTGDFLKINHNTKIKMLDGLYNMIKDIDCVGISILINKNGLWRKHPTWKVFNTAWIFLIDRYNSFLKESDLKIGHIRVDKSSNKNHEEITKIFYGLIDRGTRFQTIDRLSYPKFVNSSGVGGIQIADAFAYCTFQHKMKRKQFDKYWNIVYSKLRKHQFQISDFGYIEYPK